MQPDDYFLELPQAFWANVRTISQGLGYTVRARPGQTSQIKVPTADEIVTLYRHLGLSSEHLFPRTGRATELGRTLMEYFPYRAAVLEETAEPNLMDVKEARALFDELRDDLRPRRPFAMNKQRGDKSGPALLTGMVNMILESHIGDDCDYDPRQLTTVTRDGLPVRTLARRVDGAYPAVVNPIAVWEIKEYYHTTTFGSRVADGVYETMLDGLELKELREHEGIKVKHYLIVDSHYTWWGMGRSYLCRIVDMLHMGLVDEVLFGREVVTRLPVIIEEWLDLSDV
ncbi:DUF7687 domain-containing protein [Nocardioides zeae]|uniref:Uncharacterized protein n=1 Tax=Nocardioides zeae TaxID=1457234 RepID=A0AAJ1X2S5_9ACTN|nr:hypothetical protein [Nocardioides zeae]MDQ1106146.1 hypothetical protein [Nocardioides zeae]